MYVCTLNCWVSGTIGLLDEPQQAIGVKHRSIVDPMRSTARSTYSRRALVAEVGKCLAAGHAGRKEGANM